MVCVKVAGLPIVVEPFLKVTVPVGMMPAGTVMVAVKVSVTPVAIGFAENVSVVVVCCLETVAGWAADVLVA